MEDQGSLVPGLASETRLVCVWYPDQVRFGHIFISWKLDGFCAYTDLNLSNLTRHLVLESYVTQSLGFICKIKMI